LRVRQLAGDESAVASAPPPASGRAPRGSLAAAPPAVQSLVADYLVDNWEPDEVLLRLALAFSRKATGASVAARTEACAAHLRRKRTARRALSGIGVNQNLADYQQGRRWDGKR